MTIRTASGPRFSRPGEVTDLHEELEDIRTRPGLVEQAAQTVRRSAPAARTLAVRTRLGWARVRAAAGSLAGLACLSGAGWQAGTTVGLVCTGVSFFVAEFVLRPRRSR